MYKFLLYCTAHTVGYEGVQWLGMVCVPSKQALPMSDHTISTVLSSYWQLETAAISLAWVLCCHGNMNYNFRM